MKPVLARIAAIIALALVFLGTTFLDFGLTITYGYVFLILGALALVALPEMRDETRARLPVKRWMIFSLVAFGLILCLFVAITVREQPEISGRAQATLWLLGCVCFIFAGGLRDSLQKDLPTLFQKRDWLWMAALVCVATLVRCSKVGAVLTGLVYDELVPLGDTLAISRGIDRPAFWVDSFSHNGIFYHFHNLLVNRLEWLGFDLVQSAKLMTALAGGISVAALYAMARVLGTRPLAATASVLLIFQGWHWVLSSLYYAYVGDLLWLSLSTALLLVGIHSGRMAAFAGAAVTATFATAWLKTGILAAPWMVLVMLNDFIGHRHEKKSRFKAHLIALAIFAVTASPLVIQIIRQPSLAWRYQDVNSLRTEQLQVSNHSPWKAYAQGLLNVTRVLQVEDAQLSRHSARPKMPLLDLVFSGLATVGFMWVVWNARRNPTARFLLLGLGLFMLPSIISFPEDAPAATSRRMAFCSILLAWIAAQGAAIMAERILPQRTRFAGMMGLASISALLNIYGVRTWYGAHEQMWYDTLGGHRPAIIRAIREAAKVGPVFYHASTYLDEGLDPVFADEPNVTLIKSSEELRTELTRYPGRLCTVILPWASPKYAPSSDSPRWIQDLADVIPTHSWTWGPEDFNGVSLYRMAKVFTPQK